MMDIAKNVSLSIVASLLLVGLAAWLGSDFLPTFLEDNLITILIALLAINITTLSVITSKLSDLSAKDGADFSRTIGDMKQSVVEQCVLIGLALVIQIVDASTWLHTVLPMLTFAATTGSLALLVFAVIILYDTANAVFILLNHR